MVAVALRGSFFITGIVFSRMGDDGVSYTPNEDKRVTYAVVGNTVFSLRGEVDRIGR